jgi:hypothetical protein
VRFIPLAFLTVNTPLGPAAVRARLAGAVAAPAGGPPGPLRGTVGLASFALRRATRCPPALAPEFRGRIEPRAYGARVTGMVSLGPAPVLALAVAGLAAFLASADSLAALLGGGPADLPALAPLAAVALAWALAVRGVGAEARRLRQLMRALLLEPPAGGGATPPRGAP